MIDILEVKYDLLRVIHCVTRFPAQMKLYIISFVTLVAAWSRSDDTKNYKFEFVL